jgi:hypothetical protein
VELLDEHAEQHGALQQRHRLAEAQARSALHSARREERMSNVRV